MFNIGNMPLDFSTQTYYNTIKPDTITDWQLKVQLKLIFPTGEKQNRDFDLPVK